MNSKQNIQKRLQGLHALRGIAASAIIIFHIFGIHNLELPTYLQFIKLHFGLAVPLFFVVSSFSLYLSTFKRVGDYKWVGNYFLKRFFRIAPLFYTMILLYIVLLYLKFGKIFPVREILINFLFLYNFFPGKHESIVWAGWTIGVESLFYLVIPLFLVYIRSLRSIILPFFICAAISIFSRSIFDSIDLPKSYSFMSFLGQLTTFMVGIPAFFIYKQLINNKNSKLYGYLFFAASFLLISYLLMENPVILKLSNGYRVYFWAVAFALLILSQVLAPLTPISNRATFFLGEMSFSLYLFQPLIIFFLKPVYDWFYGFKYITILVPVSLSIVTTFIVVVPIAYISYVVIETPGISFGQKLIYKRIGKGN